MPSQLFSTNAYRDIEQRAIKELNAREDFLSISTASSPRAAGDAIQEILADNFQALLGNFCAEYSADFARRAMADLVNL